MLRTNVCAGDAGQGKYKHGPECRDVAFVREEEVFPAAFPLWWLKAAIRYLPPGRQLQRRLIKTGCRYAAELNPLRQTGLSASPTGSGKSHHIDQGCQNRR